MVHCGEGSTSTAVTPQTASDIMGQHIEIGVIEYEDMRTTGAVLIPPFLEDSAVIFAFLKPDTIYIRCMFDFDPFSA